MCNDSVMRTCSDETLLGLVHRNGLLEFNSHLEVRCISYNVNHTHQSRLDYEFLH